ncbi:nitrogen fixation protein NifU [Halostagnicola larsenii XH-48]|uniref:Nitrogen fixation protein NifU n=1 Tax=Halostagnicola larsenii XH-48 TaxID=797299 RepID=W0JNR0_9EURY|nr:hypothetical protein [Halostagnicola larsenii]AHG00341.1 nitrogen fixation protein NifU [Halostagnicola larsenii XH-48]
MRRRAVLRATGGVCLSLGVAGCLFDSDAEDPTGSYEPLDRVSLEGAAEAVVGDDGETTYVAGVDGFATVDVTDPEDLTVLTERKNLLEDENAGDAAGERFLDILDVKVSADRLVVAGPANRGFDGVFHGFLVYDVSDPAEPVLAADPYETDYHIHNCFVDGDILYVAANKVTSDTGTSTGNTGTGTGDTGAADTGGGSTASAPHNPLVVFDISGGEIEELARWSLLEYEPDWADVDWLLRYLHDITVTDGLAALSYWNAGTYLLDVSDPTDPQVLTSLLETDLETQRGYDTDFEIRDAQFGLPGNDHFAAVDDTGDILAIGRESWETDLESATGPGGIDLYDFTDPANPIRRSTIEAPEGYDETYGGEPWTTSHNFELRDGRLYSSWYGGGVKIHDLSDLASPAELAWWREPTTASFWTARVITPGETFAASSTAYTTADNPENALYTFPIESSKQADPPSLTDPSLFR